MACVHRRGHARGSNLAAAAVRNTLLAKKLVLFFAALLCSALVDLSQPLSAAEGKFLSKSYPDGLYATLAGFAKEKAIAPSALPTTGTRERKIDDGNNSDGVTSELLSFVEKIEAEKPALVKVNQSELPNDSLHAALRGAADHGSASKIMADDGAFSALQDYARQIGIPEPELAKPEPLKFAAVVKGVPAGGGADGATYIGSKTCLGCHSSQAAQFGETLMGRIGKTSTRQIRVRKLPWPRLGACQGRWRARRRRHHFVPQERHLAHCRGKQHHLSGLSRKGRPDLLEWQYA